MRCRILLNCCQIVKTSLGNMQCQSSKLCKQSRLTFQKSADNCGFNVRTGYNCHGEKPKSSAHPLVIKRLNDIVKIVHISKVIRSLQFHLMVRTKFRTNTVGQKSFTRYLELRILILFIRHIRHIKRMQSLSICFESLKALKTSK
jgi:hypothetical protein